MLKTTRNVSTNIYCSRKRTKENLCPILDTGGNIVVKDEEKAEVLSTFFALVFSSRTMCFLDTQSPELENRDREENEALIVQEEMVSELLHHSDTHKFMGLDAIHPEY